MSEPVTIPGSHSSGKESPPKRSSSSTPPRDTPSTMLSMATLRSPLTVTPTSGCGLSGNNYSSSSAQGKQTPNSSNSSIPLATSTPSLSSAGANSHTNNNHSTHQSSTSHSVNPAHHKVLSSDFKRKPSLNVVLPSKTVAGHGHNGSSDSLNKSPISPGSILGEEPAEDKQELTYKVQRKNYRLEKLRVAQELSTALKNPSIMILSGSLKVRGKLKGWTKLWAVLRPGMLLLYKSNKVKSSHWVATVLLQCCKVIERPSKKDGFCFKLFHPMDQSIWAPKGPDGETMGAVVQPLPATYLICRAASSDDGKCWMDGLELALTCSSLLLSSPRSTDLVMEDKSSNEMENDGEWCASDEEDKGRSASEKSDSDASRIGEFSNTHAHDSDEESHDGEYLCAHSSRKRSRLDSTNLPEISSYVENKEDFAHTQGEQSEVLADENKSLLWFLLKQVRPGMDLSRVVLPTFILEPRSFLDKLSDYYYHADILAKATREEDPFQRMKSVVRWYLSGFYKKPKGLKKPYNPVLGETFRCMWRHPDGTETFYAAEQVSHHPPVSAFYVSNRKGGFVISSSILAKSKFYGNSTSAILEGQASLTFLNQGEVYLITMPYAHCKGILLGTLSMELGGQVTITCAKTGYATEMDFKLKGMLSRADVTNAISGKIKHNRDTVGYFEGHWDSLITYKEKKSHGTAQEEVFWEVTDAVKSERLTRFTIPIEEQEDWESEKLWIKVSEAIQADDQEAATVEKTKLEERQRFDVKDRSTRNVEWMPRYFDNDGATWRYKHADYQAWDEDNDIMEYECDYVIATHRKRARPLCRTDSAVSDDSRKCDIMRQTPSDQVVPTLNQRESNRKLIELLRQLLARQIEQSEQIEQLKSTVASIQERLSRPKPPKDPFPITNTILAVVFAVAMQILVIIYWFGDGKLMPDITRRS